MADALDIHHEPDILLVIGLIITFAFLGSKFFQRLGIPQVVGYIVMGVLLGASFLDVVPLELAEELTFISTVALGLIGFDMGSHLLFSELRHLGRSILFILLFEALGTFVLVTAGIYAITQSIHTSLIFGALASATAPAATVDVLAEYEAKGPLTTSLLAVVGMDDAVALLLFSIIAAITETMLADSGGPSLVVMLELPLIEIGGAILSGAVLGWILSYLMSHMRRHHDAMALCIGFVFVAVGIAQTLGFSLILTTMVMGIVIVNLRDDCSGYIRHTIEQAGPVIYVLFFALVGSRLQIGLLPSMGLIGIVYVLLRSFGKITGAWLGGTVGGAAPTVRNNLGLGLLSQAGVAIGLAIASANRFEPYGQEGQQLGALIISVITATTFVVQIIGPISTKMAIGRAGEIGRARLEHDRWASEGPYEDADELFHGQAAPQSRETDTNFPKARRRST
jgi:Kef-type K+ transport system membrane component KefB